MIIRVCDILSRCSRKIATHGVCVVSLYKFKCVYPTPFDVEMDAAHGIVQARGAAGGRIHHTDLNSDG